MGEIRKQIGINVPVKQVFGYVADPRNAPRYISSITRVISGPEGEPSVGQVWKAEADFLGQKRLLDLRIDTLIPYRLVRFVLEGEPGAVVQLRLTAHESTPGTMVDLSLDANGVPALLLNALLGGLLGQDMIRLKRLIESQPL